MPFSAARQGPFPCGHHWPEGSSSSVSCAVASLELHKSSGAGLQSRRGLLCPDPGRGICPQGSAGAPLRKLASWSSPGGWGCFLKGGAVSFPSNILAGLAVGAGDVHMPLGTGGDPASPLPREQDPTLSLASPPPLGSEDTATKTPTEQFLFIVPPMHSRKQGGEGASSLLVVLLQEPPGAWGGKRQSP